VFDLNATGDLPLYVDGADEATSICTSSRAAAAR